MPDRQGPPTISVTANRYATAAIKDSLIGDWVLADNPEFADSMPHSADNIHAASCRVIRAEMDYRREKPDVPVLPPPPTP